VLRQIRLLVFDLDYLIFDCAELKMRALRESLISFADAIPHDVPLPGPLCAEEGFRDHGFRWMKSLEIGLDEERMAQLEVSYREHEQRLVAAGIGRIYSGLPELLQLCGQNGASAAIGAEASRDYLLNVSDRHGLDSLFELAYCTEEFGAGSADEMVEEIMRRAEVNPSETLALGTRLDYFQAAHNIDVLTIGCGWGVHGHEPLRAADLQAFTMAQVYSAIERADAIASRYLS